MAKKAPKGYFYNVRGLLVKKLDAATIKAIKERFPNKEFDFDTFKYGVPQTDPMIDQLRNMDPARIATVKKRRSKEDYKAKRRVQESKYYRTNRERILQNLKEKYRSDQTIGDTGKTLKQLTKENFIISVDVCFSILIEALSIILFDKVLYFESTINKSEYIEVETWFKKPLL